MKRIAALMLVLVALLFLSSKAFASVYAFYNAGCCYNGVQALISAPGSLFAGWGQSHAVSANFTTNNWTQAGWRYYQGYAAPFKYSEQCCTGGQNGQQHPFSNSVTYKVEYIGSNYWCAYADGILLTCYQSGGGSASVTVQSEAHVIASAQYTVYFQTIRLKNPSTNAWTGPTNLGSSTLNYDCPYETVQDTADQFHTSNAFSYCNFLMIVHNS